MAREPEPDQATAHTGETPASSDGVRVCFASLNTAAVSELCIRSMHGLAGHPFRLTVGDCGSDDGSIAMFETFAERGMLDLELAPDGRRHGEWIDHWVATTPERYLVVCDSDVEYLQPGWLHAMVTTAQSTGAALGATRIQARDGVPYTHPSTGATATLAARPEPWLMLLDLTATRGVVTTSFLYEEVERADGTKIAYDVAAAFFRDLELAGLPHAEMPASFADAYRHYSGLTWQRRGVPWRRRAKQAAKAAWVRVRLTRARRRWP